MLLGIEGGRPSFATARQVMSAVGRPGTESGDGVRADTSRIEEQPLWHSCSRSVARE